MALTPGTRLGAYEVTALIGVGGMGQVYRATDTRLKRAVAVKVLPQAVASDADRLARFQREAEVLASLNHPNVAQIYGLEEAGGTSAIVMELVEGPTLADRIASGPFPLAEALPVAKQCAEALEAAHEQGIVHRDFKPANVKVREDGLVKVLDFGLAKAMEPAGAASVGFSQSPTLTTPAMTMAGTIMGTAAYMSPEQARGKPADKRADIWAFGCVLAEMLSGRQVFTGETVSDVMAAILTRDIDWDTVPAVPGKVRELLARCLQKDPLKRLRDIGDARILIEEALTPSAETPTASPTPAGSNRRRSLAWAFAVVLSFVAGLGAMWIGSDRTDPRPSWSGTKLGGPEVAFGPRVSPKGSLVAFQAMVDGLNQVAVMQPESGDWRVLTEDRSQGYIDCALSWSADERIYYGRWYGVPRGVFSVPAVGGEERLVVENAACPEALADGSLLVIQINDKGQYQVYRHWPGTDRQPRAYPLQAGVRGFTFLRAFRDGKEAVVWAQSGDQPESDQCLHLYTLDLTSGSVQDIQTDASLPCEGTEDAGVAVTIGAEDQTILVSTAQGGFARLLEIPRRGGRATQLASTTSKIRGLDTAFNGDVYIDQFTRPMEIISMDPDGGQPRTILTSDTYVNIPAAVMPDGRVLFTSEAGGRRRVLAARPGQNPTPFIQTTEESSGPVALAGHADVALLIGPSVTRKLAIVSQDGRNVRRLEKADGRSITSLAASADGKTLYYAAEGTIWAIARDGSDPRRIQSGHSVVVDPRGNLIVQLLERDTVRLERVPEAGGQGQALTFPDVRLALMPFTANAVRADGAIIKNISTPDSWLWSPVILFPDTGKVQRVPLPSFLDVHHVGWAPDGKVMVYGLQTHGSLWRLRRSIGD
ncbi:MAG TPA: protein kinase [Gemmatimonadales bacterium]|nr:protein kinase [Gemmatimonadales bacterium]